MHILHVIDSMDPKSGGPSQGIRNLDMAMRNRVIREVVCLDAPNASYLGSDDFIIHAVGPGRGVWHYSNNLLSWLTENLCRFDVIIINGLWRYHSYATWRAINLKKKNLLNKRPKLLVMPHGMLDPYFQKAKERRLKAIRNWIYWKLIEKKVVNDADGLLFTCETEMLLARRTFKPYHPKKEYNVGYGIEQPPAFHPKMAVAFNEICSDLNKRSYILFLSRIHPKKGINLLIEAYINLYKLQASKKDKLPLLVIAGPGLDTAFAKQIKEKLLQVPEIKENVFFPGMLAGDAKWGAFYGCEAFVLPSHQENFGIAVVEALACGKPVLISDQVNIWREISAGKGGLVGEDDLKGVQFMLKSWIDLTGEQRNQMGVKAVEVYQKYFNVNKIVQNYFDVFDDSDGSCSH